MKTFTISTKADKNAVEKSTVLQVNTDCSPDIVMALALQSLVVKVQGQWRKHGIPATATINMADYTPGTRHGGAPINIHEAVKVLSAEERAVLIVQLQEME